MKRIVTLVLFAILFATLGVAQSEQKNEIFGGYEFINAHAFGEQVNVNGWDASVTRFVTPKLGFTADFSGAYVTLDDSSFHGHSFLFGPTYAFNRSSRLSFSTHVLLGVTRITSPDSDSALHPFSLAAGGAVDYKLAKHVTLRPIQLDYFYNRITGDGDSVNVNSLRYYTGVVYRF